LKVATGGTEGGGRRFDRRHTHSETPHLSRSISTALIAAIALGAAALAAEPASATPMAGAPAIEAAAPAASAQAEQVYFRRGFHRGFGFRRGFGYRRPFGYRRYGYGYRRGLPGHPIRRILRAL
jgi:hypothetical protein